MPMSQHRPALVAILVAIVAVLVFSAAGSSVASAQTPPTNPIAATALSYDGTWQGQCWQFMKKVVREATGKEVGFDYRQGYFDAGASEVSITDAQPGDIIQLVRDSDTSPSADYPGLHTAIILRVQGGGSFTVVDSNQNWDGMVNVRAGYKPAEIAAARDVNFHVYRITATSTAVSPRALPVTAPVPGQTFAAGDRVVTYTPGDVLNVRSGPAGTVVRRLPDGTHLTVVGGPVISDGHTWIEVSGDSGDGWVASEFLSNDTPLPAGPAAEAPGANVSPPVPVLQFRTFAPQIGTDDSD